MKKWINLFTLLFCLTASYVFSQFIFDAMPGTCTPNNLYLGTDVYYMNFKHEHAKQTGWLYGIRTGYDYIQPCFLYVGGDFLYAKGNLTGTYKGKDSQSKYTDLFVEARGGYTFGSCELYSFSPFIGGGYANEENNYTEPSIINNELNYGYICAGFLSELAFHPIRAGLSFKARYMLNGKSECNNCSLPCKNKWHYRIDLPLSYRYLPFEIVFSPFYEFRQYGSAIIEPLDFVDSKIKLYGATLKFNYCF